MLYSHAHPAAFYIGGHAISSRYLLAPMAGISDLPFRQICRQFGAGLTTCEMVSSDTKLWQSNKSRHRLNFDGEKSPISIQIAGSDPSMLAEAAQQCVDLGADIIDINMGCPVKKVCKKLAGSALLQNEALVEEILQTVVQSVSVPVTLKTRTGWDTSNKNGVTIAKIAEDSGIKALAIHGRTRADKFNGAAEYDTIAQIVQSVSIPVIANGDITSPKKAHRVLAHTGAAGIMIGRAAQGNPWIFAALTKNETHQPPILSTSSVLALIIKHFEGLYGLYGEQQGVRIARKHFGWYCNTLRIRKDIAKTLNAIETKQKQIEIVRDIIEQNYLREEKAA